MTSAISRPYSLALDVIRVCAALVVVACHAGQLGLLAHRWPLSEMVQHTAVIVFFILSGLVISNATMLRETALPDYAIARFSRIMPVAVAGIVLGNAIWFAGWYLKVDLGQPPDYDQADWRSALLPLVFMSEALFGSGPVANPPFWSLCYEVWYYAIFAAATFFRGRRRFIYVTLLALFAGPRIVILMPVWLAGVWLQKRISGFEMTRAKGATFILVGAASAIVIASLAEKLAGLTQTLTTLGYPFFKSSQFWLADWLITPSIVAIFAGAIPWSNASARWLERFAGPIRLAAGSSFTIYIIHWPILSLATAAGIRARNLPEFVAMIAALVALAVPVAALLEQRLTFWLRRELRAAYARRCAPSAIAS